MGSRELRDTFNETASPDAKCIKALLNYKPQGGVEYQILTFSGNFADGTGFVIQSDLVRPGGDVMLAARAAADRLLAQRRGT